MPNVHHVFRLILPAALIACAGVSDPAPSATDFVTDSTSYTLRTTSTGHVGRIETTFTNATGATVFFANCNGGTSVALQRRIRGDWTTVWGPDMRLCLSPPITVAAGARHRFAFDVVGGLAGSNASPRFTTPDIPGEYRLLWGAALSSYQASQGFGDLLPLEHRISNGFTIAVQ